MNRTMRMMEAVNYDAQQFLASFTRFREGTHAIDTTLCENLLKIISQVDEFLDSKPKEITMPLNDQLTPVDIKKFGIKRGFICKPCELELGESLDCVRAHLGSLRHLYPKKTKNGTRKAKLENMTLPKSKLNEGVSTEVQMQHLPSDIEAKNLIQGDLKAFFTDNLALSEKLKTLPDYRVIEDELLTLIRPAFPNQSVKLYLFGSRISGVGSIYSDLDMFLDIGEVFNKFENRPSQETIRKLQTVQELLRADPNWVRLISIQNARVPILKIFHQPTSTNCDIGFSNSLGFCNTKLIAYLLDLQPLAKAMSVFVKKWLDRTKLNEDITTYATMLLVINFLQIRNILPSVKMLQVCLKDPVEIGPWMATFAEKSLAILNIKEAPYTLDDVKKSIKNFFKYYSTFDFANSVISPYVGHTIRASLINTCPLIPRYVKYIETEKETRDVHFKLSSVNVQDPFQLNHNVTKACTSASQLKQYFELSANLFTEAGFPKLDDEDDINEE